MIITVRTRHGEEVARKIAMIRSGVRTLYIGIIFNVPSMPGHRDYIYSTDGRWVLPLNGTKP